MLFSLSLIMMGVFLFFFYNVHYLLLFLGLEVALLGLMFGVYFVFLGGLSMGPFLLFLLVVVCLGGFSISLLVSVSRSYGRDFWFHKHIL